MALFRLGQNTIEAIPPTAYHAHAITERGDLQRLLRANIAVISQSRSGTGADVLVICEEFSEWQGTMRRIDLLGIDRSGNLVVIELKRDDDGQTMELQAIRYAAMVSAMTFAKAVEVFQGHLNRTAPGQDAQARMLEFLGWEEPREDAFAQDVRIMLVAADFSKELMTSVLWLSERDIDIRCVRMKPYIFEGHVLIDVQQVLPLPEAQEYTVQIREKQIATRAVASGRNEDRRSFWEAQLPIISRLIPRWSSLSPIDYSWLKSSSGSRGVRYDLWVRQHDCGCQLYIDAGDGSTDFNKAVFDRLMEHQAEIDSGFGTPLQWDRADGKRAAVIYSTGTKGGYRSPRTEWPQIHSSSPMRWCDLSLPSHRAFRPRLILRAKFLSRSRRFDCDT